MVLDNDVGGVPLTDKQTNPSRRTRSDHADNQPLQPSVAAHPISSPFDSPYPPTIAVGLSLSQSLCARLPSGEPGVISMYSHEQKLCLLAHL